MRRWMLMWTVAAAAAATLAGCARLTEDRFAKVYNGQPQAQVKQLLGEPKSVGAGGAQDERWLYVGMWPWRHEATIQFREGRVVGKQWLGKVERPADAADSPATTDEAGTADKAPAGTRADEVTGPATDEKAGGTDAGKPATEDGATDAPPDAGSSGPVRIRLDSLDPAPVKR